MSDPVMVLDYWLGDIGPEGWYAGGEDLDDQIRGLWLDLWTAARDRGLDHWADGPAGSLALIILADQFPRNMFRGTAAAFATDPLAREIARKALAEGWDMQAPEPERQFFYMPFEHSEDPADQDLSVELFSTRMPETGAENLLHARAHAEIIRRYGRFPFRNAALGRESTPEEEEFLQAGAYAGVVRAMKA